MKLPIASIAAAGLLAACGGYEAPPAPATAIPQSRSAPALTAPAAPGAPEPAPIVDVLALAGSSQDDVAGMLGEPTACQAASNGQMCSYKTGQTEIVFIDGEADWITVEDLDTAPYSVDALPLLGIEPATPTFSSDNVLRWEGVGDLRELSIFPEGQGVDYAYIKARTQ